MTRRWRCRWDPVPSHVGSPRAGNTHRLWRQPVGFVVAKLHRLPRGLLAAATCPAAAAQAPERWSASVPGERPPVKPGEPPAALPYRLCRGESRQLGRRNGIRHRVKTRLLARTTRGRGGTWLHRQGGAHRQGGLITKGVSHYQGGFFCATWISCFPSRQEGCQSPALARGGFDHGSTTGPCRGMPRLGRAAAARGC